MAEKRVIYYENVKGKKYVKEFISNLDSEIKSKILARLIYLGEHWDEMERPLVEYIEDKLYAVRIQFGKSRVRIIYAYMFKDHIVLLHAIMKKAAKIPENDKLRAKKRMLDFQIRYNDGRIKLR